MTEPLLGWISPRFRTQAQMAPLNTRYLLAHVPPRGVKVILTSLWADPDCVADMGREFIGFHQLTGSCVGVSSGDAICTLSCVQRKLGTSPTKAFIPFWPFPYGRTRANEGDRGQGEGAVDSVMGETLAKEGSFDWSSDGLPKYKSDDGLYLTSQEELKWSDGNSIATQWMTLAKDHLLGVKAVLNSPEDVKAAVCNGYPVLDGCDRYVGNGSIKGSGDSAYVVGHYDGSGGHSTCILGYWDHPTDGPLYLYSNQWPTSTYPKDPAGGGRCCVWIPESEMTKLFHTGGSGGESMALSHQNWFPAQPSLLDWYM